MTSIAVYFLACCMIVDSVSGGSTTVNTLAYGTLPRTINSQCVHLGYLGACKTQNFINDELTCLTRFCAKEQKQNPPVPRSKRVLEAIFTGVVDDGTPCSLYKVCDRGVCVPGSIPRRVLGISPQYDCITSFPAKVSIANSRG